MIYKRIVTLVEKYPPLWNTAQINLEVHIRCKYFLWFFEMSFDMEDVSSRYCWGALWYCIQNHWYDTIFEKSHTTTINDIVYKSIYFNNIKSTQIILKKTLYNIELVRIPASSVFGAFFLARILLLISEMVIFGNGTIKDLEKAVVVWSSNWKLDSLDPINEMEYLENK